MPTRPLHLRLQLYRESLARNAEKYRQLGLVNMTLRADAFTETLFLLMSVSKDEVTLAGVISRAVDRLDEAEEFCHDWAKSEVASTWDGRLGCDIHKVTYLRWAAEECRRQAAALRTVLNPDTKPEKKVAPPESTLNTALIVRNTFWKDLGGE